MGVKVRAGSDGTYVLQRKLHPGFRDSSPAPAEAVGGGHHGGQLAGLDGQLVREGDPRGLARGAADGRAGEGAAVGPHRRLASRESRDGRNDRRYEIDLDGIVSGKKPSDNLILQPGDTLVVP